MPDPSLRSGSQAVLERVGLVAAAEFGEQAEHFEVEPDQGDEDAECAVPLHVFGRAIGCAAVDEVEVEDEVECGNGDDDEGEADADESRAIDGGELEVEEAEDHLQKVEEGYGTGGGYDAEAELLRDLNESGAVGEEEGEEGSEGEGDGLDGDAGVTKLKEAGDAAEEEAFAEGVDGRGDGGPGLFEDGDEGEDEAADDAEHEERGDGGCVRGAVKGSGAEKRCQV